MKSYAEKLAAIRAVERVAGVRGIANELAVSPPRAFEHTDVDVAETAIRALQWRASVPTDRVKARVEKGWVTLAHDRKVTLKGSVHCWDERREAEYAAWAAPGVASVENELAVVP